MKQHLSELLRVAGELAHVKEALLEFWSITKHFRTNLLYIFLITLYRFLFLSPKLDYEFLFKYQNSILNIDLRMIKCQQDKQIESNLFQLTRHNKTLTILWHRHKLKKSL